MALQEFTRRLVETKLDKYCKEKVPEVLYCRKIMTKKGKSSQRDYPESKKRLRRRF